MKNQARLAGLAALLAALAVAGCSSGEAATQPPNLNGTSWRVVVAEREVGPARKASCAAAPTPAVALDVRSVRATVAG